MRGEVDRASPGASSILPLLDQLAETRILAPFRYRESERRGAAFGRRPDHGEPGA